MRTMALGPKPRTSSLSQITRMTLAVNRAGDDAMVVPSEYLEVVIKSSDVRRRIGLSA